MVSAGQCHGSPASSVIRGAHPDSSKASANTHLALQLRAPCVPRPVHAPRRSRSASCRSKYLALLFYYNGTAAIVAGLLAIGAGNRNIAIFLVALPPEILAPIMVFIGCWQLPMYLTPILLRRMHR